MSSVSRYGYVNAKLRGRIGKLKSSTIVEQMVKSPTLVEAIQVLRDTHHNHLVEVYDKTGDLEQVELALLIEKIDIYKRIATLLDDNEKGFINVLLQELEIENLKNVIRLWYSNVVRHVDISSRANYIYKEKIVNDIDVARIINGQNFIDILESVKDLPYAQIISKYNLEKLVDDGLFNLEVSLDHFWYKNMLEMAKKLDKDDREIIEKIYGVDIDLKNILMLFRYGFYHEMDKESVMRILLPYGKIFENFDRKQINEDNKVSYIKDVVNKYYPSLIKNIEGLLNNAGLTKNTDMSKDIVQIESYLADRRRKEFIKILSGDPFTIGIILAYLSLVKAENNAIRAVLIAKSYAWDEQRIREEVL